MVFSSPNSQQESEKETGKQKNWLQHAPLIVGTVALTVVGMIASLQVMAMLTPEAQKTINELYDLKKENGVELRELNTKKMQQELDLAESKRKIAEIEEMNARADVCIDKLQDGSDETCDPETLKTSESSGTGASVSSAQSSGGF